MFLDACVFIASSGEALPDRARLVSMIDGETIEASARLGILAPHGRIVAMGDALMLK
jgi:hypothetical protein